MKGTIFAYGTIDVRCERGDTNKDGGKILGTIFLFFLINLKNLEDIIVLRRIGFPFLQQYVDPWTGTRTEARHQLTH